MDENQNKIDLLAQLLENAQDNLNQAKLILKDVNGDDLAANKEIQEKAQVIGKEEEQEGSKIVEGVFNGENMVGPDGKIYNIPANYVSKSKLVEGDILKLTITGDGSFLYKQIGPVKRKRIVGTLIKDGNTGEYRVNVGKRSYKVITAAVTYYKGEPGDEAVLLTSVDGSSKHAAVENIVKAGQGQKLLEDGDDAELPSGDDATLSGAKNLLNNSILEDID